MNKLFDDLKVCYNERFAALDAPGGCEAFALPENVQVFPDIAANVTQKVQLRIFAVQELRRIFSGCDEHAQRARFRRSWIGRICGLVLKDCHPDSLTDVFGMVEDHAAHLFQDSSMQYDYSICFETDRYVTSVARLCQVIVLIALNAANFFDWGKPGNYRFLERNHESEHESTIARCAVYKAVVDHQERLRFLLPSEIGYALLWLFARVNRARFNCWSTSNSLLAGLIDNRADIEPGSPEEHVFSVITSLPLREFMFRNAPHSLLFLFSYDTRGFESNGFTARSSDICKIVAECRPHFAHEHRLAMAVWGNEMRDCLKSVLTEPSRSFEEIAKNLVLWHTHFDFSRGWNTSSPSEYYTLRENDMLMPDPLVYFIRVLLEKSTKTTKEGGQTCRFGVECCELSDRLSCEHETRLMRFIIWLAEQRQPCDFGVQSVRMWMSLCASVMFNRERTLGFEYAKTDDGRRRTCDPRQFWPNLLLDTLASADLRARLLERNEKVDWQSVFNHTRTRLQPFVVELLGACSPTFVEQCELTTFGGRTQWFSSRTVLPPLFGQSVLKQVLQTRDCLHIAQPLFERWKKQILIRLLRGATHHSLTIKLWQSALHGGHTWLCEDLFTSGYPAFLDIRDPTDFGALYTPLSLPMLVTRRMIGKQNVREQHSMHIEDNPTDRDEAREWLERKMVAMQGMVDSEPFWAGQPTLANATPHPRRAEFLSLRDVFTSYDPDFVPNAWKNSPLAYGLRRDYHNEVLEHRGVISSRSAVQEFELLRSVASSWISYATSCNTPAQPIVPTLRALCIKTVYCNGLLDLAKENAVDGCVTLIRGMPNDVFLPSVVLLYNPPKLPTPDERKVFRRIEMIAEQLERQADVCCKDETREVFDYVYVRYARYQNWPDELRSRINEFYPHLMHDYRISSVLFSKEATLDNRYINFECIESPSNSHPVPFSDVCLTMHVGCLLNHSWGPPSVRLNEFSSATIFIPFCGTHQGVSLEITTPCYPVCMCFTFTSGYNRRYQFLITNDYSQ